MSKNTFYVSNWTFWGLVLWKNIKIFSSFPDFERKHPGFLVKEFQPNCKEWIRRARETSWRIFLEKRTKKLLQFPDFEQKTFADSPKFSTRLIKNAFKVSTAIFWGFLKKFTFSLSLSHYEQRNESTFGGELSRRLSNCCESTETFWGETFFPEKI